jgi:hypothetical protein
VVVGLFTNFEGAKPRSYVFGHGMRGRPSKLRGKPISEERKNKIRIANLGRKHTPEELEKMKEASRMGKNGMYGKHHSEESKQKMSISMVAAWTDRKRRKKLS